MATKTRKTRRPRSSASDDILHGLRELVGTIQAGRKIEDHFAVLIVGNPDPTPHTAMSVRTIRQRLGVSQAEFAKLVGVLTNLV